jgi:hypothetical protein
VQGHHRGISNHKKETQQIGLHALDAVHAIGQRHKGKRRQRNLGDGVEIKHHEQAAKGAGHDGKFEALFRKLAVQSRLEHGQKQQQPAADHGAQHHDRLRLHHAQGMEHHHHHEVQADQADGDEPFLKQGALTGQAAHIDLAPREAHHLRSGVVEIHDRVGQWKDVRGRKLRFAASGEHGSKGGGTGSE